jgi:hypothetical protein
MNIHKKNGLSLKVESTQKFAKKIFLSLIMKKLLILDLFLAHGHNFQNNIPNQYVRTNFPQVRHTSGDNPHSHDYNDHREQVRLEHLSIFNPMLPCSPANCNKINKPPSYEKVSLTSF